LPKDNPAVAKRAFLHYFQRSISAAAVRHNDFADDVNGLGCKTGDGSSDMPFLVETRNNDDRRKRLTGDFF
jgi:hypothetical protein